MGIVGALAFCLWVIVAFFLYIRLPPGKATIWNFLGAQMLLPTGFYKFPMILPINKSLIPTACAAVGIWILSPLPEKVRPKFGLVSALLILYIVAPFISALANADAIIIGDQVLPGVGIYDGLSATELAAFTVLPFVCGRRVLRRFQDSEDLLRILMIAGLVYSLPMLFEIRFSPQLHYWIYGFYSSEFVQEMRAGGYRPMVFMGHGLVTSFFLMTTVVSTTALWRTRTPTGLPVRPALIAGYLGIVLLLCKSLGAALYCVFAVPLIRLASARTMLRVAILISVLSIGYPLLRAEHLIPTDSICSLISLISDDRARSLEFRFINEDRLLDRARERPMTGWGRFGRNRVYEEGGNDITVTDGHWIIVLGQFGVLGFIAEFGLLTCGIFRAMGALKFVRSESEGIFLAALALILSLSVLDLLPNATITPFTFLLAGALVGRADDLAPYHRRRTSAARIGPNAARPAVID
jgi:hypothetical protein